MSVSSDYEFLRQAIDDRSATIGVVGVGYIGLPTAAVLASVGFKVIGIDVDSDKISSLNKGECYIDEPDLPKLVSSMVRRGLFKGSTDPSLLEGCDVILFCTQTPLDSKGIPDLSMLFSAVAAAREHASSPLLAICESTVPPGTTREIGNRFLEDSKNKLDENLWVSHCPERVLPGRVVREFRENPRVIGGITPASADLARELYSSFVSSDRILETNSVVSEFAKLAENTFRDVNIALANELARAADVLGLDVTEAISLANLHPRVTIHKPGIGVGGHCIPKDPVLLSESVTKRGYVPDLVLHARALNNDMPSYAIRRLEIALGKEKLRDRKVVVLGTTYKEDVDDTRRSPTASLVQELVKKGAEVRTHDYRSAERFGVPDAGPLRDAVEWADVVVLAVAHSEYLLELPGLDFRDKVFLDGRNAFDAKTLQAKKYLGVGKPVTYCP